MEINVATCFPGRSFRYPVFVAANSRFWRPEQFSISTFYTPKNQGISSYLSNKTMVLSPMLHVFYIISYGLN